MKASLVDEKTLRRDPRKLPYLYPSMKASVYKLRSENFYRQYTIRIIEEAAKMLNHIVVPATCIHHKRRKPDRRVKIFGRTYYILQPDDLTTLEYMKYLDHCGGGGSGECGRMKCCDTHRNY